MVQRFVQVFTVLGVCPLFGLTRTESLSQSLLLWPLFKPSLYWYLGTLQTPALVHLGVDAHRPEAACVERASPRRGGTRIVMYCPNVTLKILLPTFSCHSLRRTVMNAPSCRRHKCSHTLRNTSDTAWHKCVSMTAHLSSHSSLSLSFFTLCAKGPLNKQGKNIIQLQPCFLWKI